MFTALSSNGAYHHLSFAGHYHGAYTDGFTSGLVSFCDTGGMIALGRWSPVIKPERLPCYDEQVMGLTSKVMSVVAILPVHVTVEPLPCGRESLFGSSMVAPLTLPFYQ